MKIDTQVRLVDLILSKKLGGHVIQNGRHKWWNTKYAVPEFFPYPCGGGILTVKSNCDMIDILRTDCWKIVRFQSYGDVSY